jgi:hypothetical protein
MKQKTEMEKTRIERRGAKEKANAASKAGITKSSITKASYNNNCHFCSAIYNPPIDNEAETWTTCDWCQTQHCCGGQGCKGILAQHEIMCERAIKLQAENIKKQREDNDAD